MTTDKPQCGKGEITIDGVTANIDFTVEMYANQLNKGIDDHSLWFPPIFEGLIYLMPPVVFGILKDKSKIFKIVGEVQKGAILTCDNCKVLQIEDYYEERGHCISCNIAFDIGDPNNDFHLEYTAESGDEIE